jgi:hypothetical protein
LPADDAKIRGRYGHNDKNHLQKYSGVSAMEARYFAFHHGPTMDEPARQRVFFALFIGE